jgi:DNA polymerase
MSKTNSLADVLRFCAENGLDEIISEKSQNHFLTKDPQKKLVETKRTTTVTDFVKPVFSSAQAISSLAQKFHQSAPVSQNNFEENLPKKSPVVAPAALETEKYLSLNEIIASAKKLAQAAPDLASLRKAVENFDGCNLKKMATNTVFCDGNSNSEIMVIGEAPGNNEDLQGIPFCGDSGKVLDAMFRAINMTRKENFYISNVIFWRPPGNRRPTPEELAICRPFVERHIQLLAPKVLVLVGATAMESVLGIKEPVSSVRGKFMDFAPSFLPKKIKTFIIFHPSYLMRQSQKKKVAWRDMLELERFLQ